MQDTKPRQQQRQERRRVLVDGVEVRDDVVIRNIESTGLVTSITWEDSAGSGEIKAKGLVLTDNGTDIKTLGKDGYLFIKERRGETERELKVLPGADGSLKKSYFLKGTPGEFDAEAREWLSRILLEVRSFFQF